LERKKKKKSQKKKISLLINKKELGRRERRVLQRELKGN